MIVAEFIQCQRTTFGIPHAIVCPGSGVSQFWFYQWINRVPTARAQRRSRLDEEIKRLFTASGGTYGSTAVAADVLWCGDVTLDTDEGPLYLATTEDLFSRRMLGHALSTHHDAALVVASLQMAATVRGGDVGGVIFHSDRGSDGRSGEHQQPSSGPKWHNTVSDLTQDHRRQDHERNKALLGTSP